MRTITGNEESGEDGENETEADQEMGAVDQSEENKLDPDLWDKEDDNEKDLAEGNEGFIFIHFFRGEGDGFVGFLEL